MTDKSFDELLQEACLPEGWQQGEARKVGPDSWSLSEKKRAMMATLDLALCYEQGKGVEKNEQMAFRLTEYVYANNSIDLGDDPWKDAAYRLIRYYREGVGTPVDNTRAERISNSIHSSKEWLDDILSR